MQHGCAVLGCWLCGCEPVGWSVRRVGVTLGVVHTVRMGGIVTVLWVRGGVMVQQCALRRALECQPRNIATVGLTESLRMSAP